MQNDFFLTYEPIEKLQDLWSGYGSIKRYRARGSSESLILKHIQWPVHLQHPRGWQSDLSHERKVRSYQVEATWYRRWASLCDVCCRVPQAVDVQERGDEWFIWLEDLDRAGFPVRKAQLSWGEFCACLDWLAHFHATFMHCHPEGLWPIGTYWHLDTRPDELAVLEDKALQAAAGEIDRLLNQARFLTFVHGDAKLANFCFSGDASQVAMVDFQYVGGGCGMKDVAYFVGSCFEEEACERLERAVLEVYFQRLRVALKQKNPLVDVCALEAEWRGLYPVAWADFHRFLKGWSPGHWKINSYSERIVREVLQRL